jgi:hypothetical protein
MLQPTPIIAFAAAFTAAIFDGQQPLGKTVLESIG